MNATPENTTLQFVKHPVDWTNEKSGRFWNFMASADDFHDLYFSKMIGRSLLRYLRRCGVDLRSGEVLDFGCGPGFLLEELVRQRAICSGLDFSPDSVRAATKRLKGKANFLGCYLVERLPSELAGTRFSAVFLIEVIEHLLDDELEATLAEIHRVTKPGGYVIVTTPNEENLQHNTTLCPDCGCIFHRMQHVRTWNADSLSRQMANYGFERVFCRGVFLPEQRLKSKLNALKMRLFRYVMPHLIYVGRKTR